LSDIDLESTLAEEPIARGFKMEQPPQIASIVDDMFFAARIRAAAESAGRSIATVKSLEHLRATAPSSLIIIDLNSSRVDAIEAIRTLKSDPDVKTIPIVGFVSHVQTDLITRAREAGCDHVLPRSAFTQLLPAIVAGQLDQLGR
jgi:CheY-like chemotaxis protein